MTAPFDLDKALEAISESQDGSFQKYQDKERAKYAASMLSLDAVGINVQHGQRAVQMGVEALRNLKKDDPNFEEITNTERARIAEGYALQGEYRLAVQWAPEPKQYQDILDAIHRPNSEVCDCRPKPFVKMRFYYKGHIRSLMACPQCNLLNAI